MAPLDLSPTQEPRALAPAQAPIVFVVLTTWADKAAGTAQSRWRWSNRTVYYPFDGTERLFEGVLEPGAVTPIVRRLGELQPEPVRVRIANRESATGSRLWSELRAANLYGASVEVARYFPPPEDPMGEAVRIAAADHQVIYRGDLVGASESGGVVELAFEVPEPELALREEFGDAVAPKDFGATWPYVFGEFARVKALTISSGARTTLAQPLTKDLTGNALFTEASKFPASGSFSVWINGEEILCSGRTGNLVQIQARGQGGTKKSPHQAGEIAFELADVVLAVGAHEIEGIDEIFVRAPNGELVALPLEAFSPDFGPSGSTLTISATALRSILASIFVSAAVTVQPAFQATEVT